MSKQYYPTIGLEIHAELKTETKMFCGCLNNPDEEEPNVNICPVCMAHPGTLPVINKKAVEHVIRVGLALEGEIANFTEFDRKNYFYPDIPKGYQISQYKYPIVSGGILNNIAITRVHLEEDTAKSFHSSSTKSQAPNPKIDSQGLGIKDQGYSLVDFNRAGVPLMELVTEPVIHSAEEANAFAREFQLLLRYLNVSDANMEKGQLRVEVNISLLQREESPISNDQFPNKSQIVNSKLGTKVEIKNLNSFRAVEKAIEYEIKRQTEILERGGKIVQETRGWDEKTQKTFSQRKKESSHDYRYFPDPDLPKLKLHEIFNLEDLKNTLPELPWQKRNRLKKYNISDEGVEIFVQNMLIGNYFESVISFFHNNLDMIKLASNYITSDILSHLKSKPDVTLPAPVNISRLIEMITNGEISSRGAKDILEHMHGHDDDPMKIALEKGLLQKSDESELKAMIEKIIAENETVVAEYKQGKETALQYLIGQIMKASKGSANPQVVAKIFKKMLE